MQVVYYFMHCKDGFVYFRKIGLHHQTVTSDGMKAVLNMGLLNQKLNGCKGNRKLELHPRLTVMTW